MGSEATVSSGISGVRCAVGLANQDRSTLLKHWLRPAEGSPFEETMKARNGVSFVPSDHLDGGRFYRVQSPISTPNGAVAVGDWDANPKGFGSEAPRTVDQCRHVDGSTLINFGKPEGVSFVVWEIPQGVISVGRAFVCQPRGKKASSLSEEALEMGDIRFHYALPDGKGGWKVSTDVQRSPSLGFVGNGCTAVVGELNEADRKSAKVGGMWVAIEWKQEAIFGFDYLVAM